MCRCVANVHHLLSFMTNVQHLPISLRTPVKLSYSDDWPALQPPLRFPRLEELYLVDHAGAQDTSSALFKVIALKTLYKIHDMRIKGLQWANPKLIERFNVSHVQVLCQNLFQAPEDTQRTLLELREMQKLRFVMVHGFISLNHIARLLSWLPDQIDELQVDFLQDEQLFTDKIRFYDLHTMLKKKRLRRLVVSGRVSKWWTRLAQDDKAAFQQFLDGLKRCQIAVVCSAL